MCAATAQNDILVTRIRIVFLIAYIVFLAITAYFLLPDYWWLWLLMLALVVYRVVIWVTPKKQLQCRECGTVFPARKSSMLRPSAADLYEDPNRPRCPKCGSRNVAKVARGKKK